MLAVVDIWCLLLFTLLITLLIAVMFRGLVVVLIKVTWVCCLGYFGCGTSVLGCCDSFGCCVGWTICGWFGVAVDWLLRLCVV